MYMCFYTLQSYILENTSIAKKHRFFTHFLLFFVVYPKKGFIFELLLIIKTLNMSTETKTEKSNLSLAYEQVENLKLNLTLDERLHLNDVLCNLATEQFSKGLDTANEIHKKYDNL